MIRAGDATASGQARYVGPGSPLGGPAGADYVVWLTERIAAGDEEVLCELRTIYRAARLGDLVLFGSATRAAAIMAFLSKFQKP